MNCVFYVLLLEKVSQPWNKERITLSNEDCRRWSPLFFVHRSQSLWKHPKMDPCSLNNSIKIWVEERYLPTDFQKKKKKPLKLKIASPLLPPMTLCSGAFQVETLQSAKMPPPDCPPHETLHNNYNISYKVKRIIFSTSYILSPSYILSSS